MTRPARSAVAVSAAAAVLVALVLAAALGMPVGFPAGHEGSAFGAALLGMQALGLVASIDRAAELVGIDAVVEPDPAAAAVYAELLPTFARLYDDLSPAFRALHDFGARPAAPTSG